MEILFSIEEEDPRCPEIERRESFPAGKTKFFPGEAGKNC
jgi:hypothetical protein